MAAGAAFLLAVTLLGTGAPGARAETVDPTYDAPGAVPVPERIIVRWHAEVPRSARVAAREGAGTDPVATLGRPDFQLLGLEPGRTMSSALAELRADPRVASADPDRYLENLGVPDDPDLPKQWALGTDTLAPSADADTALGAINVEPAWDRTVGSPQTVVAVIDGGYDFTVPDLASVAWRNPGEVPGNGIDDDGNSFVDDVRGWDFVGSNVVQPRADDDPSDDDPLSGGHGSHVAGILGARGNDGQGISGVAQNVRIMPLRVCARAATQAANRCLLSATVEAVNYAGRNGAEVANLSLGGAKFDQVLVDALAANPRTLYVAAAGNDAHDNEKHPVYPCSYQPVKDSRVPGRVDNVVCVAALGKDGRPATFTNWGAQDVDLAAPGVDIWSVYRQYRPSVVWADDFEGGDFARRWVTDGPGLGAPGDGPLVTTGLTDSPGAAPTEGTRQARTRPFRVPADAEFCEVRGERFAKVAKTEDFSYSLWVDGAESPATFSYAVTWANPKLKAFSTDVFSATGLAGEQVSLHVDHTARAGQDAGYGFWLDNLKVVCGSMVRPAPYAYLSGTSMASPMVAGAAALLYSLKPSATVTQVRGALLGSAHKLAAWRKRTTTGGRLDVAAAMGRLAPPDTAFASPVAVSGRMITLDVVQRGKIAGVRFQCRLDAGRWLSCNPAGTVRGLRPGPHQLQSRAVDPYGNVDRTPASATFTVEGCLVPRLVGARPAAVRSALARSGCRIGKVLRPKGVPASRLRVRATYPRAGTFVSTSRAPVTLVMVRR